MPGNVTMSYEYLGTDVIDNRGFGILVHVDGRRYEIPIEWIPDDLTHGTTVEISSDGASGTIVIKAVEGNGPQVSVNVTGG